MSVSITNTIKKEVEMKTFQLLLFSILGLIISACVSQNEIELQPNLKPVVMVVGIDISETMDGYPSWTESEIKLVCHTKAKRGTDVWLCIKMIGNPSRDSFRRIELLKTPNVDSGATLSIRVKQRKYQEFVNSQNEENINKYVASLSLERKGELKTCINDFCFQAIRLLNEPQFNHFQKILVIYSDGYEDSDGDNITEPLTVRINDEVSLYYIGWRNSDKLIHTGVTIEFADIEGFLSYIKSINN
ncbi:MAG: hypothetical protein MUO72_08570 [Bacteroidales bacterium]|nr:hypothetical protein [Bacteroidales bacterium]